MNRSIVIKRLGYEGSAALDNLRYMTRRIFIVSERRLRHERLPFYLTIDLTSPGRPFSV